ncbi:hypothetical protein H8356DRAFT_1337967 [Neocallimastix lanati (nom. inval.)]|nr:hypothetical protein H8356DRAFT_1337967 [Neocallimastix sp. JGI-2020a]
MGFICFEYNTIKSQISRNINKTFDEIPDKSEYYKIKRDERFVIFKMLIVNSLINIFNDSPQLGQKLGKWSLDGIKQGALYMLAQGLTIRIEPGSSFPTIQL